MSAVDVLAIFDEADDVLISTGRGDLHSLAAGLSEARAAVAELIAAADVMAALMPDAALENDDVQGAIVARLRTALAHARGEA